jgi:hypothetical protein
MLTQRDPHEGGNRHIDINNWYRDRPLYDTPNPKGINRPVDLNTLIVEIVVSPYAESATFAIVEQMVQQAGYDPGEDVGPDTVRCSPPVTIWRPSHVSALACPRGGYSSWYGRRAQFSGITVSD